jgi:hypothetical protein
MFAAFENYCRALAKVAFGLYCRDPSPLYLYGAADDYGNYPELKLAHDKPKFWDMVIYTMVPRNMTEDQLQRWFVDQLRAAPVMPAVDLFTGTARS